MSYEAEDPVERGIDGAAEQAGKLAREHGRAPWFARAAATVHEGRPAILLEVHFLEHHLARRYGRGWGGFPVLVRRAAGPSASKPAPLARRGRPS